MNEILGHQWVFFIIAIHMIVIAAMTVQQPSLLKRSVDAVVEDLTPYFFTFFPPGLLLYSLYKVSVFCL